MVLPSCSSNCDYVKLLKNEIKKLQARVEHLLKDQLTGAYNRHYLEEMLSSEYKEKLKDNWFYKLYLIDINNLHEINRNYGYHEGDKLIKEVATEIKKQAAEQKVNGTLYRIGGDEFLFIFQPYDDFELNLGDKAVAVQGVFDDIKKFNNIIKELDDRLSEIKKSR